MQTPLDILMPVIGSHGDVHPFVGIGVALRQRGHRVRIIVNEHFAALVRGAGLESISLGTAEEYREIAGHPDLWHPSKGPRYVFRQVPQLCRDVYTVVVQNQVPGRTVVVHSSLALGARIAQDKHQIPTATVHLQPAVFRSAFAPPTLPGFPMPRWLPRPVKRMMWRAADRLAIDPLMAPGINAFRAELGLEPIRRVVDQWWNSPQLVIGLFPEWFAPPQPDWPRQAHATGFPLYDESDQSGIPGDLLAFLEEGAPPIAFTPGSAMWRAHDFFAQSVLACQRLNRRGLLLSRHLDHIPQHLPPTIRHVPFAPFSKLLPRCAALVHHGGIGTSAQAMACGVRQLVTPFTHDQPDNAQRMRRLGIATSLTHGQYSAARVATALERLLASASVTACCSEVAARFPGRAWVAWTCALIEGLRPRDQKREATEVASLITN